eukprot:13090110-Alexandrium_andersonii.AAC.2
MLRGCARERLGGLAAKGGSRTGGGDMDWGALGRKRGAAWAGPGREYRAGRGRPHRHVLRRPRQLRWEAPGRGSGLACCRMHGLPWGKSPLPENDAGGRLARWAEGATPIDARGAATGAGEAENMPWEATNVD